MLKRFMAALLILCMFIGVFIPLSADASTTKSMGKRYNIMLVMDGSGSLVFKTAGYTDPRGMRYALVGELMGLLEDDGHNVGAVVFSGTQCKRPNPTDEEMEQGIMLNTGLLSVDKPAPDGRTAKDYLESEIQRVYVDTSTNGCTDIGTALKVAQEQLDAMQAQNGLESILFLFTDGNTAFYGNPAGIINKSVENRDNATLQMSQNGIRLFGVFLNHGGKLDDTEMKRLVCAANGISTTSPEFQYSYVEIENSSGIHEASTRFMEFLGYIKPGFEPDVRYDDVHDTFTVPGIGVEEMNIRLFSPYGDDLPNMDVKITQPDGTVITGVPMKESRTYRVYKLVQPDPGDWKIDITVPAGNALAYVYTPVVSLYIDSMLESNPVPQDLCVNQNPTFTCMLSQAGIPVANPAAYMGYDCELLIKNVSNGDTERYSVQANTSGSFTHDVLLDTYGTFEARTIFSCGEILVESNPILLDLTNRIPTSHPISQMKLKCGLFQPKTTGLDLTQYFSDPEDGFNLTFSLGNSTCNPSAILLNGTTMVLTNQEVGDGTITISATDSQGASVSETITVNTTNVTIWYIIALIILLVIIAIIVFVSIKKKNNNRPDGILSVSFDMPVDGKACRIALDLDVPGVDTTSKTNLNKLLQNALRNENKKIQNGIYARDVMGYLMGFTSDLSGIAVCATTKKKGKKTVGAISVKQDKKLTILYDSFADFFLNDTNFTVEFQAADQNDGNPFDGDGSNPSWSAGQKKADNPFDSMDDAFFQVPAAEPGNRSANPIQKDFPREENDIDFF